MFWYSCCNQQGRKITMILWVFVTLLCLQHATVQGQFAFEYSESVCNRPWIGRMMWSNSQQTTSSSEELRTHILLGKPVKVLMIKGGTMESFEMDNLNMNGQVICGEAINRMSSPIDSSAEFQPIIVCTDGFINYLNVSENSWSGNPISHVVTADTIVFSTRDYSPEHKPVTSRYLDGSTGSETNNHVYMAIKSEMRGVMRDRGYAFTFENTHIKEDGMVSQVSGQSLSHISQSYNTNGGITFRDDPYFWYSSWETTGRRDSARWMVGDMKALKHTNDYVALQWYADACWTIVYSHDMDGKRMDGSLDMLKMYIKMGHRVRVHFNGYTLEANSIRVSPDDVIVAQTSAEMARRGGKGPDSIFFNTKTRRVYRLFHTTGLVRSFLFFVESGQLSEKDTAKHNIFWSVDTRPWNPVLTTDETNNVTMGSALSVHDAYKSSSFRVKIELKEKESLYGGKNSELYLEINNLRTPDINAGANLEVIGQSLRTVPYWRSPQSPEFFMTLYKPVSQYIEVSTKDGVTVMTFDMKSKEFRESPVWPVASITWFKDQRIYVA